MIRVLKAGVPISPADAQFIRINVQVEGGKHPGNLRQLSLRSLRHARRSAANLA